MADFIFSSKRHPAGKLAAHLSAIPRSPVQSAIRERDGSWGTLAFIENHFYEWGYYEDDTFIVLQLGGPPVRTASAPIAPIYSSGTAGCKLTCSLLPLLRDEALTDWSSVLNGPFALLVINKPRRLVRIITDLLLCVPIYEWRRSRATEEAQVVVSSHPEMVAKSLADELLVDTISAVDFILHGYITYPYTLYEDVKVLPPASDTTIDLVDGKAAIRQYWLPREEKRFDSIDDAADGIRKGLQNYVESVAGNHGHIASLLSGGEDSRAVLGMLDRFGDVTCVNFTDALNREVRIARQAAKLHGRAFYFREAANAQWLDKFDERCLLTGSTVSALSTHPYTFNDHFHLWSFDAVFGGILSDTLIKGHHVERGKALLSSLESSNGGAGWMAPDVHSELQRRRIDHFKMVKSIRARTAGEWACHYPIYHGTDVAFFTCAFRLFRAREPFMSNDVIKSA